MTELTSDPITHPPGIEGPTACINQAAAVENLEACCLGLSHFLQNTSFNMLAVSSILYFFVMLDQTLDRERLTPTVLCFSCCPLLVPIVYKVLLFAAIKKMQRSRIEDSPEKVDGGQLQLSNSDFVEVYRESNVESPIIARDKYKKSNVDSSITINLIE